MTQTEYESVIGLEVHAELKTKTKIFCSCPTTFGAPPNTQCCPVCLGLPGALPVLNRRVLEIAVVAGLALQCSVERYPQIDRKQYFYPDLPKGYQISQHEHPLCKNGFLTIAVGDEEKKIGITRIHIEEDAGKLTHEKDATLIDCNRCGVPLIEIVSEPDLRTAEECVAYLKKLRAILLYTGVSDCRMQEGSLRCDVNLSVRKKGSEAFGVRTEIKNLNSFQSVAKAIEYETKRQIAILEAGGCVMRETLRFDQNSGKNIVMRKKEKESDYRFLREKDLLPVVLREDDIKRLREEIPPLPDERKANYRKEYLLSSYDAETLTLSREVADFFECAARQTRYPKLLANLITGELFRLLPAEVTQSDLPSSPAAFAVLANLTGDGVINSSVAKKLVAEILHDRIDPALVIKERGLAQITDQKELHAIVLQVFAADPKSVSDYLGGRLPAAKALIGAVMAKTKGRADPVCVNRLVTEELHKRAEEKRNQ